MGYQVTPKTMRQRIEGQKYYIECLEIVLKHRRKNGQDCDRIIGDILDATATLNVVKDNYRQSLRLGY